MLVKLVTDLCFLARLFDKTLATWKPEVKRELFVHFFTFSTRQTGYAVHTGSRRWGLNEGNGAEIQRMPLSKPGIFGCPEGARFSNLPKGDEKACRGPPRIFLRAG